MSKRFGRNQKRKMQEQIDTLNEANDMCMGLTRWLSNELNITKNEINEAKVILGSMSSALPAEEIYMENNTDTILIPDKRVPLTYSTTDTFQIAKNIPLHVLASSVSKDKINNSIHTRVKFKDGSVGYAISNEAFMTTPKDFLIQRISQEIAHQLVNHMRSK